MFFLNVSPFKYSYFGYHVSFRCKISPFQSNKHLGLPLPKFNIAPEKWWLEDNPFLLGAKKLFRGELLNFGGGYIDNSIPPFSRRLGFFRVNFSRLGSSRFTESEVLQEPKISASSLFIFPQTIPRMKVKEIRFAVNFGAGKGTQKNKGNKNQAMRGSMGLGIFKIYIPEKHECTSFLGNWFGWFWGKQVDGN